MRKLIQQHTFEVSYLLISYLILVVSFFIFKSNWMSLLVAILATTGNVLNSKANKATYFFLIIASVFYTYIAFSQKLYGEALLDGVYLFPLYTYSAIVWRKKSGEETNTDIYTATKKQMMTVVTICLFASIIYGIILHNIGSSLPYLNALGTVLCVSAGYFSSKRIKEQWYFWILYNIVVIAVWFISMQDGLDNLPILLLNLVTCPLSFVGLYSWFKIDKLSKNKLNDNRIILDN